MAEPLAEIRGDGHALGALLFLAAGTNALDVYSALNSSPWTAENFGADPKKAKSCMEYVMHSIVVTSFYAGVSGLIARSWWPIVGAVMANIYMFWLYRRALKRGSVAGSSGWANN